jgi:hypothetical protein
MSIIRPRHHSDVALNCVVVFTVGLENVPSWNRDGER